MEIPFSSTPYFFSRFELLEFPTKAQSIKVVESTFYFAEKSILLGRQHDGSFLILFPVAGPTGMLHGEEKLSSSLTLTFRSLVLSGRKDEQHFLQLKSAPHLDLNLLEAIASEIFLSIDSEDLEVLISRIRTIINRWKSLLSPEKKRALTMIEQIGLAGELFALESLVNVDPFLAVESWVGPLGGAQDFDLPNYSVEVKTTASTKSSVIKINGLWQVEEKLDKPVDILLLHLDFDPLSGTTLLEIAEKILSVPGIDTEQFRKKIQLAGLDFNDKERVYPAKFSFQKFKSFLVTDALPFVTRGKLSIIDPDERILSIEYSLDLSNLESATSENLSEYKWVVD